MRSLPIVCPWILALAALGALPSARAQAQAPNAQPKPSARVPQAYDPARVRAAFDAFDRDGNHWLSFRELRAALGVDRREFVVYDSNQNGMVEFDEFDKQVRRLIVNGAVLRLADGAGPASQPAHPRQDTSAPTSRPSDAPFTFGDMKDFKSSKTEAPTPFPIPPPNSKPASTGPPKIAPAPATATPPNLGPAANGGMGKYGPGGQFFGPHFNPNPPKPKPKKQPKPL